MIAPGPVGSTTIRSPAGHALTYEETERRLARVLTRVPITRVYDATPLDWLGLPVWAAVTPLAVDLTVHAGKGLTPVAARISAVMEAIERVSAESVDDEGRIRGATFTELRHAGALDPELFGLPCDSGYRADRPLSWIGGHDLLTGRDVFVALDLVLSPAREGICSGVETNGLAAGNHRTEAVLHALHEVVERDALAHNRFARLYADGARQPAVRVIDRATLPVDASTWVRALHDRGLRIVIQDLSHDLRVPVFRATIYDNAFPGREGRATTFEGLGADLDPAWAVSRAICEAVQSHTVLVVGARDSVEDGGDHVRLDKRAFLNRLSTASMTLPFTADAGDLPDDLEGRLRMLLDRVAAAGIEHCVIVDLTRADLGIPVVRVLVPGLAGPFGNTTRRPPQRLLRLLSQPPPMDFTRDQAVRARSARDPRRDREFAQSPPRAFAHPDARRTPNGVGPHPSGCTREPPAGGQLHVFIGPSLESTAVAATLPDAAIEPPIARGDLAHLREEGARTFLILDGAFAHRLAVPPSEIVDAIASGASVIGAASLGAIRAAECWPAGMDGVGAVYRLYRLGILRDDDEVAVATDPDREYAAVSVALVNVRYAMLAALRARLLDRARAAAILEAARQTYFAERRWKTIFADSSVKLTRDLYTLCLQNDIKRHDAKAAVAYVADALQSAPRREFVGHRLHPKTL